MPFAHSESAAMKRRVQAYMISEECPLCHGKRLRREALNVTFAGLDITEFSRLPLARAAELLRPYAEAVPDEEGAAQAIARQRMAGDLTRRLDVLLNLGLGYLQLERSTPTLSPGELQRLPECQSPVSWAARVDGDRLQLSGTVDGKRVEGVYERRFMERQRSHFRLVQPDDPGAASPERGGS